MKRITSKTLSALRDGDQGAFEAIFAVYSNKLKVFIYGYVKSEATAQELMDRIFVSLWENRETIDPDDSLDAYLYSLARDSSINFLRDKFASEDHIECHMDCQKVDSCEDEAISKEAALLVDIFVDQMPPQCKEIYNLSRKEGLSSEQIARRLNTTERNVESQLNHVMKTLKKAVISL